MVQVLKRLGQITKDKQNRIILVNENREGFVVDEVIAFVWSRADGNNRDELVKKISEELRVEEDKIKADVNEIVDKLKEAKLLNEEEKED